MYLTIVFLPLLASIASGFFGRKLGVSGSQLITCSSVITTTVLGIIYFFEIGLNNIPVFVKLFTWIGPESAIGLSILVAFYRLRGSVAIEFK